MSDVQSAAERLKRCEAGEDPVKVYDPQRPAMRLGTWGGFEIREAAKAAIENDYETLADAWLAEHDPTPINRELLIRVGFAFGYKWQNGLGYGACQAGGHTITVSDLTGSSDDDWSQEEWIVDDERIPHSLMPDTYGDVRQLFRKLGIPLTP